MDLLITDAVVVTADAGRRVLDRAAVALRGDCILAVGESAELEHAYPDLPRFSGRGKAVLPGLINSHTHAVLTVLRGTVEDMEGDIVYGYMTPVSFVMSPEERAVMATLGCLEAIRCGTTTLVEPFRHLVTYGDAMVRTGLRLYFGENCADAVTLRVRHGEYRYDRAFGQEFLDRTVAMIERFHGRENGRVQCQIAAHATDNCSPWMLERLLELAKKYGLRRTIHLAQGPGEVAQVRKAWNATPAEYLRDHDWLGPDLVAAHWTYCTESDIDLLADHGVHMAHCPANSSRRGPHRVRVDRIQDRGINIAFGTDNMTEDMFHAMKIGLIVHRGSYGLGVRPTPQDMLDAVTRNGALALDRLDSLGTVEPGKKADLTIIDLNQPALRPTTNLVSNIVHYGHPGIVDSVIADGEFLMRERKILTIDEASVLREAQAVTECVWSRMLAQNPDLAAPASLRWLRE